MSNPNTLVVQISGVPYQWTPTYDLTQFAGQTLHWTAAACNGVTGCVYQQSVRQMTFPPLLSPLYIRNWSQYDINEVWLVRGGGPGVPLERQLLTRDLSQWHNPLASGSRNYSNEILVQVPKRHDPSQEPTVQPYYALDYMQEQAGGIGGQPALPYVQRSSVSFAPGVHYLSGYAIVRETLFLLDYNGLPSSRHELVVRGPDDRLNLYRPCCDVGQLFEGHPEVGNGPIPLQTLMNEGYGAYDPSRLGQ
jgi:hypothetical protein